MAKRKKDKPATKEELSGALAPFDERAEQIIEAWRAVLGLPKDFSIMPIQVYVCMAAATAVMDRYPATKNEIKRAEKALETKKGASPSSVASKHFKPSGTKGE